MKSSSTVGGGGVMDVDHHDHRPLLSTIQSWGLSVKKMMNIRVFDLTVLSLILFIGLLYIFLSSYSSSNQPFFPPPKSQCHPTSLMFNMSTYRDELEEVLAETSMANKSLIIAVVNKAYVEGEKSMLDLFMDGFWLGENTRALRDHLLIIAVDQTSYERCRFLGLHCYKLETDGVDFGGEKLFMSDDFIKMMWRRTLFLGGVLKRGYNFIFTDTDVLWLRNPFSRLVLNETLDLQISTDGFNGNEMSRYNRINTGFYMIRSNNKTIALFDSWYAKKDNSTGMKEQDVLQALMKEPVFTDLDLNVRFLDTLYFSGFCQDSRDVRDVVTVHANCCRSISAKVADLTTVLRDWKRFKRGSANETLTFGWTKHVACENSWRH
ncbi:uncharacterized protein At1g28695-like isoform X1 [Rhododendron vialii]|uniref:uncharacterized protein At1g28695-like isoform X1 n=1 Tax=Rhododendron vialii TaxID=182163 RepID=UPI00265FA77D|nr:uncharacterized protein At1g28695-like isoform X1 [Rhododendron vialii]